MGKGQLLNYLKAGSWEGQFTAGFAGPPEFYKQWEAYATLVSALDPQIDGLRMRISSLKGGSGAKPGAAGERVGEATEATWGLSTAAGLGPVVTGEQGYWKLNGGEWRYLRIEMIYVFQNGATQVSTTCTFPDTPFAVQNQGGAPTLMTYDRNTVIKASTLGLMR